MFISPIPSPRGIPNATLKMFIGLERIVHIKESLDRRLTKALNVVILADSLDKYLELGVASRVGALQTRQRFVDDHIRVTNPAIAGDYTQKLFRKIRIEPSNI